MIDLFWYVRITNPYTLFAWIANPSNARVNRYVKERIYSKIQK